MPNATDLEMDDFCNRFEASMVMRSGRETFSNGCKVAEYAKETAPAYWEVRSMRELGPEACAQSDMRYWHDA